MNGLDFLLAPISASFPRLGKVAAVAVFLIAGANECHAARELAGYLKGGTYFADRTEVLVLDDADGKPLRGVAGLIGWQVESPTFDGSPYRFIEVSGSFSGEDGKVRFPGMAPRSPPLGSRFTKETPRVLLFKADYLPEWIYNRSAVDYPSPGRLALAPLLTTVRLRKNSEPLSPYISKVVMATGQMNEFIKHKDDACFIEKFAPVLSELMKVEERMKHEGVVSIYRPASSILSRDAYFKSRGCVSIVELVRAIQH